jgi:hypothetical protein
MGHALLGVGGGQYARWHAFWRRSHMRAQIAQASRALPTRLDRGLVRIAIAIWRDTPTAAGLERVDSQLVGLTKRHAKFGNVIVMEPKGFGAPDQQGREAHAQLTNKFEAVTFGIAIVIDGSGVKHSLFRFVLTTVQLISSPRVPQRNFQSIDSAAHWLASFDKQLVETDLVSAIREARALSPGTGVVQR